MTNRRSSMKVTRRRSMEVMPRKISTLPSCTGWRRKSAFSSIGEWCDAIDLIDCIIDRADGTNPKGGETFEYVLNTCSNLSTCLRSASMSEARLKKGFWFALGVKTGSTIQSSIRASGQTQTYIGKVVSYSKATDSHKVHYEDNDVRDHNLTQCTGDGIVRWCMHD